VISVAVVAVIIVVIVVVIVVVASYLPWFDVFFKLLNYVSDLLLHCMDDAELSDVKSLLEWLMRADVSVPLQHIDVSVPASGLVHSSCCSNSCSDSCSDGVSNHC